MWKQGFWSYFRYGLWLWMWESGFVMYYLNPLSIKAAASVAVPFWSNISLLKLKIFHNTSVMYIAEFLQALQSISPQSKGKSVFSESFWLSASQHLL